MDRTDSKSDTPLAHQCSADVPALRTMRRRHGAETPIGHRCSNLLEQLENYAGSQDRDQRAQLRQNIAWQIAGLAELTAGNPG